MKVIVCSTADQKLTATKNAFESILKPRNLVLSGEKAPSSINEQPEGKKEIEQGSDNRLFFTLKNLNDESTDIFVSMESGLEKKRGKYYDYAHIRMYLARSRQEFCGETERCHFPTEYVEEARKRGFDKVTVGSVMAERIEGMDKQDPHAYFGKSRVLYLQETIEQILARAKEAKMFDLMLRD